MTVDLVPFVRSGNELLLKLLGPSVEFIGESWRSKLEDRARRNADRVGTRAIQKLGDRLNTAGSVPPRVLRAVLDEAPFCDDELSAEYVSGVLASSRTESGLDDRGVSLIATVSRLSSIALRAHYIWYTIFHRLYCGAVPENTGPIDYVKLATYVPMEVFSAALDDQWRDDPSGWEHALHSLAREDLIGTIAYGRNEESQDLVKRHNVGLALPRGHSSFVLYPTPAGIELYQWSVGRGGLTTLEFFSDAFEPVELPGIEIADGSLSIQIWTGRRSHRNPFTREI